MNNKVEKVMLLSRWLLLPMYLGLSVALLVYSVRFGVQTGALLWNSLSYTDNEILLAVLHLLHIIMVSHLIVMIMIGGYALFIREADDDKALPKLRWIGHIDPGALKVKMSMSMIGVSSIHLLEAFVNSHHESAEHLTKLIVVHLVFVVSTMAIAWVNRFAFQRGEDQSSQAPGRNGNATDNHG